MSQIGRNPWGSLSPTPWSTCLQCLVAEMESDRVLVGNVLLGQTQVEESIKLIQQKTEVKDDVMLFYPSARFQSQTESVLVCAGAPAASQKDCLEKMFLLASCSLINVL